VVKNKRGIWTDDSAVFGEGTSGIVSRGVKDDQGGKRRGVKKREENWINTKRLRKGKGKKIRDEKEIVLLCLLE